MDTLPYYDSEPAEEQILNPTYLVIIKCRYCLRPCKHIPVEDVHLNEDGECKQITDAVLAGQSVEMQPYRQASIELLYSCGCHAKRSKRNPAGALASPQLQI